MRIREHPIVAFLLLACAGTWRRLGPGWCSHWKAWGSSPFTLASRLRSSSFSARSPVPRVRPSSLSLPSYRQA